MTAMLEPTHQLTTTRCDSFDPGHRLHWSLWSAAQAAPTVAVSRVHVEGVYVDLEIGGHPAFHWQHHDPAALVFALQHAAAPARICPTYRLIRVDGAWFSCAPQGVHLDVCA